MILYGLVVREEVKDAKGKVIAKAGDEIDSGLAKKLANAEQKMIPVLPFVSEQVDYLSADEEENYVVAQANSPLDEQGHFIGGEAGGPLRR